MFGWDLGIVYQQSSEGAAIRLRLIINNLIRNVLGIEHFCINPEAREVERIIAIWGNLEGHVAVRRETYAKRCMVFDI